MVNVGERVHIFPSSPEEEWRIKDEFVNKHLKPIVIIEKDGAICKCTVTEIIHNQDIYGIVNEVRTTIS